MMIIMLLNNIDDDWPGVGALPNNLYFIIIIVILIVNF